MKNLTITHNVLGNSSNRQGYRVMSAELNGNRISSDIANPQVVDYIEELIGETINREIKNSKSNPSIDIIVKLPAEITLAPEIVTHLVAKYESDPVVKSITFE